MLSALCVGAGGFLGAVLRYVLGLLPWQSDFPLITFCINFVGAFLIGAIAEFAFQRVDQFNPQLILFLKTVAILRLWMLFGRGMLILQDFL